MILNACVTKHTMVDENICKTCNDKNCRHAGEPTTKERLDMHTEKDEAQIEFCQQMNCLGCDLNHGSYKQCKYFEQKQKMRRNDK